MKKTSWLLLLPAFLVCGSVFAQGGPVSAVAQYNATADRAALRQALDPEAPSRDLCLALSQIHLRHTEAERDALLAIATANMDGRQPAQAQIQALYLLGGFSDPDLQERIADVLISLSAVKADASSANLADIRKSRLGDFALRTLARLHNDRARNYLKQTLIASNEERINVAHALWTEDRSYFRTLRQDPATGNMLPASF